MTHSLKPDTAQQAHADYRDFVGGGGEMWDRIGRLQFNYLQSQGLKPHHRFIDVGCGSLRGGVHFIHYLKPSHYTGIDKHIELVIYGVNEELGIANFRTKMPRFVISDAFEFGKTDGNFDYGIAQSLFTHLTAEDILNCLMRLRKVCVSGCRFYATFFESQKNIDNPEASHSHAYFAYTREEVALLGHKAGWRSTYMGDWGHPRGQKIIEYACP